LSFIINPIRLTKPVKITFQIIISIASTLQQFQVLSDLLRLPLGSLAVLAEVNFFFIPSMRPQNDLRLPSSFLVLGLGAGGFRPGWPGLALL
jgi:hypothetical protein